ncbi:unnamed protein product [Polarella glacialis]|uniref:Uncharacterized protein n=1 Tax=Polarella glacialis TaxID=89957 RepID=A0A813DW28_POLGL|nr:unnamed protein product [Polarella glacialis]
MPANGEVTPSCVRVRVQQQQEEQRQQPTQQQPQQHKQQHQQQEQTNKPRQHKNRTKTKTGTCCVDWTLHVPSNGPQCETPCANVKKSYVKKFGPSDVIP